MNRRPHVPKSGTNVRSLAGPTIARAWPGMALKGRNEPFAADPLNDRNGSIAVIRQGCRYKNRLLTDAWLFWPSGRTHGRRRKLSLAGTGGCHLPGTNPLRVDLAL